jgi:hypothetical protein
MQGIVENCMQNLSEKPEWKKPVRRTRSRWEDIVKWIVKK